LKSSPLAWGWIRPLATPYLRGYRAIAEERGSLRGFWFLHPDSECPPLRESSGSAAPNAAGFFVGYLISPARFEFLAPQPPECLAFVFLAPAGGTLHNRLVQENGSLVRKTFDYIRLLTHRPPRFVFHDAELATMTRHQSMREWPVEKYEHFSRNFFIESLAWLVRSGIVRKLLAEEFTSGERDRNAVCRKPKSVVKKRRETNLAVN
jgi:hypothetical protein